MSKHKHQKSSRGWRVIRTVAALGILSLALAVTFGTIAAASGSLPGFTPGKAGKAGTQPIVGHKGHATCDEPGQPACPALPNTWVTVKSEAGADVLAALQTCPDYMAPVVASGGPANSSFSFDAPVKVIPATAGSSDLQVALPHWIVRAAVNGHRNVTYDVLYDPAGHRIQIVSIGVMMPGDPSYDKRFPFTDVSATSAVAVLHSSRGMALAASYTPDLVFFAGDPARVNPIPGTKASWSGGGTTATDPIWRLKGTDGHVYFVGTDGQVYDATQLPVASGTRVVVP